MKPYDWLVNRTLYTYNYDLFRKSIIESDVVYKGIIKEKNENGAIIEKVALSWSYYDRGHTFEYEGATHIKEGRILYSNSYRTDKYEEILSIFPIPANFRFEILWGVSVGMTGGVPAAFRVLISSKKLDITLVEKEFERVGATKNNSLIAMEYNPDELQMIWEESEKERREQLGESIAFISDFLEKPY